MICEESLRQINFTLKSMQQFFYDLCFAAAYSDWNVPQFKCCVATTKAATRIPSAVCLWLSHLCNRRLLHSHVKGNPTTTTREGVLSVYFISLRKIRVMSI